MISGHPTLKTVLEAMKQGAFDYMPKLFSLQYLRPKISRLFKQGSFIDLDSAPVDYIVRRDAPVVSAEPLTEISCSKCLIDQAIHSDAYV